MEEIRIDNYIKASQLFKKDNLSDENTLIHMVLSSAKEKKKNQELLGIYTINMKDTDKNLHIFVAETNISAYNAIFFWR